MNDEAKLFTRFEHASSEAKRRIGYNPKIFIRMMHEHGAISTAKRLLASEKIQDGFYDLVTNNCIELAMESIILEPEFSCLFTEAEVNEAKRRLGRR